MIIVFKNSFNENQSILLEIALKNMNNLYDVLSSTQIGQDIPSISSQRRFTHTSMKRLHFLQTVSSAETRWEVSL